MTTLTVQFQDDQESAIVSVFASPQPMNSTELIGTVDSSDVRYKTFYAMFTAESQAAMVAPT